MVEQGHSEEAVIFTRFFVISAFLFLYHRRPRHKSNLVYAADATVMPPGNAFVTKQNGPGDKTAFAWRDARRHAQLPKTRPPAAAHGHCDSAAAAVVSANVAEEARRMQRRSAEQIVQRRRAEQQRLGRSLCLF